MNRKYKEHTASDSQRTRQSSVSFGSRTDIGRVREHNEDSLIVQEPLFAVADGMGGHNAGEVASEIAIETLATVLPAHVDAAGLGRAVMAANRAVIRGAEEGTGREGMGTTLTAALIENDHLIIAQVGDSRAYLLHNGRLQQITRDHSLMTALIESGKITPEEARRHPNRSIITRALGNNPDMRPDLYELVIAPGDCILLCSDGLSGMVEDEDIAHILRETTDAQRAADALIAAANARGGQDNITAIVIVVEHVDGLITQKPEGSHFKRILITLALVFVLLIAVAGGGLYLYARNSAYLIDEGGYVCIYRGLPGDVLGMKLSWLVKKTTVRTSELRSTTAERLTDGTPVGSLEDAQNTVASYEKEIAEAAKTR